MSKVTSLTAEPTRCDCGENPYVRLPVDSAIASVYGYDGDEPSWIDVGRECYDELYREGILARVLGQEVALG